MEGTVRIISWLGSQAIPQLTEIIENLKKKLKNAQSNRINCLIAKTTGVSVSGVGCIFTVVGFVLAPFTMGISAAVCSGIGIAMTAGGVATSVGTSIADQVIQSGDLDALKIMVETFKNIQDQWEMFLNAKPNLQDQIILLHELKSDTSDQRDYSPEDAGDQNDYLYLLQWLKIGDIYTDDEVDSSEIKKGDHIYRPSEKYFIVRVRHHGVYLGNNEVVDFGDKEKNKQPIIRSLQDYLNESKTVFRRNYNKYQIPVEKTITLARNIVREKNWERYHLFENNCEHFATFLKLNCKWSEQVEIVSKIGSGVMTGVKIAQKPGQLALDSLGVAANALSKSPGFWSNIFKDAAPGTMNGLSKTLIVLSPVMTAVDIGFLVSDWIIDQPNIEKIQKALRILEDELIRYEMYLVYVTEIGRMEKQWMKDNEKKITKWRDDTVTLIEQGHFGKNCNMRLSAYYKTVFVLQLCEILFSIFLSIICCTLLVLYIF